MSPEHDELLKRNAQFTAEWHAWRGPFIVRAALMFNVPTADVTAGMYAAAVERTQQDTMPARHETPNDGINRHCPARSNDER